MSDILTAREVADRLRCGLSTVYDMFEAGRLTGFRAGKGRGTIRIHAKSVESVLNPPPTPTPTSSPQPIAPPPRPRTKTKPVETGKRLYVRPPKTDSASP